MSIIKPSSGIDQGYLDLAATERKGAGSGGTANVRHLHLCLSV
jgi:hypothetical protein